MKIPVGAYLPDLPALDNPGASYVDNVLPAASSYRPMPSLSVYSEALTARCQGAIGGLDSSGNVSLFAGDATTLKRLAGSSLAWEDVSKAGNYTTAADERWAFAAYQQRMCATNYADPIQSYVQGVDTDFSDLSADAPRCRYLGVAKNFLIAANTVDGTDGAVPERVWWSAQFDPTSWPTPGTSAALAAQSDFNDLVGDGGWIMGMVTGLQGADFLVVQERALWRAIYIGGAVIFQFDQVEGARGTPAPGSIAQAGGLCWFLGEEGFYECNGVSARPIGNNQVDKTLFLELNQSAFHRISAAVDPINKIVFWAIPTSGDDCDVIYAYKWDSGRWSRISGVTVELLLRSLSFGLSVEDLDNISASIDALTLSLDSRVYTGGRLLLSAFNTDHRLCYFTGDTLAATVETTEAQPIPGRRAILTQAWPLVDGGSPTITPVTRNRQIDAATVGSASAINSVGFCPLRTNARYQRLRIGMAAASSWTHIMGVEVPDDSVGDGGVR
jgi:hypothetical protein